MLIMNVHASNWLIFIVKYELAKSEMSYRLAVCFLWHPHYR